MLEEENNQEFETEELEEKHGGDVPEPRLATDVRDPSASATSASYPRPHVKQVIARKFFVTRVGNPWHQVTSFACNSALRMALGLG